MTVLLTVNGTGFAYPEVGDVSWGPDATDWAVAVTNGMLQKSGGLFLLLSDVDFGGNYGLQSVYFKSRSSNLSTTGILRLARADSIGWRNEANAADLLLGVNSSNVLTFNGSPVQGSISVSDTATIDLSFVADVLSASIVALSITNAMVSASAGIVYSKLDLAGSIVNNDINASAAIARSKLATGTAHALVVNAADGSFGSIGPLTNGQLLIGSTGAAPVAASLTGTSNQITVTGGAGSVTLSTPQNIDTAAAVQFATGYFGSTSKAASAALQADSTTQGLLPPRMSEVQRDAIGSPATGLVIFNTTSNQLNVYNGSAWGAVGGGTYVANFTGTTITATNDPTQVFRYTGVSAQTITAITVTALGDGGVIEITGTDSDNPITLNENDAAGGWIINGTWVGTKYAKIGLRLDTTFNRLVEVYRNDIQF
jgi:hypothetical protein